MLKIDYAPSQLKLDYLAWTRPTRNSYAATKQESILECPIQFTLIIANTTTEQSQLTQCFMALPVEMFLEVVSYLHPADLLHLARVSKRLRVILSPRNRHIWIAASRNILGLPPCPADLNEAQYASLLFDHRCQACGKDAAKADYSLRLRFCRRCFRNNVIAGFTHANASGIYIPPIVYTLLPLSLLEMESHRLTAVNAIETTHNTGDDYYYSRALERCAKEYRLLQTDFGVAAYIRKAGNRAQDMVQTGINIEKWAAARMTSA